MYYSFVKNTEVTNWLMFEMVIVCVLESVYDGIIIIHGLYQYNREEYVPEIDSNALVPSRVQMWDPLKWINRESPKIPSRHIAPRLIYSKVTNDILTHSGITLNLLAVPSWPLRKLFPKVKSIPK